MSKFVVDSEYQGYVYVGNAKGNYDTGRSEVVNGQTVPIMAPYYNMYVISPCSSYVSDDYCGTGFKAEKKKCVSADVWQHFQIGERVELFFDDKKRVVLVVPASGSTEEK